MFHSDCTIVFLFLLLVFEYFILILLTNTSVELIFMR